MKKLSICLVSDTVYDVNGVSRFIQDFAKEALFYKKDFIVITSTKKEHYENIENIYNIPPLFSVKMPFYKSLDLVFPNFFSVYKKIKEKNPTLLHISTPGSVGLCALVSAKLLKLPIAGVYHTDFPSYMYKNTKIKLIKKTTQLFLLWFYSHYKAIFTRSKEYKKIIKSDLNFDEEKIYELKAGINIQSFHPRYKNPNIWFVYDINPTAFKVLYVGRLSVEKNIEQLLDIWKKVDIKNKALILVGDDEYNIDKQICKEHHIFALGRKQKEELSSIYASCDCFLFPSTTDTLGQVVMEALASALPVLVSNKGGPKGFVKKEFGFINDIDEKKAWIGALIKLSKKDEVYQRMKEDAFFYMQENSISKSFLDFWEKNKEILQES